VIRKSFSAITKVVDEAQGLVEAIVNSTGIVDLQKDNMNPGCWDELCKSMSLGETKYPTVLWGHEWLLPVGKVLHAEELYPGDARLKAAKAKKDSGGVRIIGQYNLETQRGREAFSDVKNGLISEWSVGFMPTDDGHHYDKSGIHQITKVGIWPEVSNVLVGASPGTYTAIAKSAEEVLATPEMSLGDKALAIEQVCLQAVEEGDEAEALSIALSALKALSDQPEPEPQIQPEAAQPAAEASLTLQQHAEWLIQYVTDRLNVPKPQHSDPEDDETEDLSMPAWVRQNIRPTT
jgi:HK97 family phage prohead protease